MPALILIGRLSERYSHLGMVATSCVAGIAYYLGLAFVTGPVLLLGLQLLNAWSFAGIAGIGLPLFQQMIPRPGLSTGLYMNTRRVGSIVSGPVIAIGSLTALGQRGIFATSAALTLIGLLIITIASRTNKPPRMLTSSPSIGSRKKDPESHPTGQPVPGAPRSRPRSRRGSWPWPSVSVLCRSRQSQLPPFAVGESPVRTQQLMRCLASGLRCGLIRVRS